MRILITALLIVFGITASAQEDIINNTTFLIAGGKYNNAEKYLDSVLHTDAKNVTALMMKGNVLLNYDLVQTPSVHLITPQDETIFSTDVATLKNNIVIVPRATALKIEKLWMQCLSIDSSRLDIQKGLCSLYGMSLMREELLQYLPVIARSATAKGDDFPYTLVGYAQLLHERGDRAGSYLVYQKIAALYPKLYSFSCQIATAYFVDNDLARTQQYVEKAMSAPAPDLVACHDALDIYTAISDPARVLAILRLAAKDPFYKEYIFYVGLYKYTQHDSTWRVAIHQYISAKPDSGAPYDAARYMLSGKFTHTYEGLMGLLRFNLNDFSTKLIATRAMNDYKDSVPPYVIAVQVLINDKNFSKANELLSLMLKKNPEAKDLLYYYAYSLYSAGDYKNALDRWTQYVAAVKKAKNAAAEIDVYVAAPYYFLGQSYLKSGNKAKAIEYFKVIGAGKDESKYAYMAKVQLDNLEQNGQNKKDVLHNANKK